MAAEENTPLEAGEVFAEVYQIEGFLGEGAFARVYRARHLMLDRLVTLKILHRHLYADSKPRKRFEREAKVLSQLNHPCIAQILGIGLTNDGQGYLAMEYVEGLSLGTYLKKRKRLSINEAKEIFPPILDALQTFHEKGIVHRDLKPDNIIVGKSGPKIIDFGIAMVLAPEPDKDNKLTQTAIVLGTPKYLSPEQAAGERIDQQSDLYSMACIIYESLAGKPVFSGDTNFELLYKHKSETPKNLHSLMGNKVENIELCALVMKNLAKDKTERSPDARSFRIALIKALNMARDSLGLQYEPKGWRKLLLKLSAATLVVSAVIYLNGLRFDKSHKPLTGPVEKHTPLRKIVRGTLRERFLFLKDIVRTSRAQSSVPELEAFLQDLIKAKERGVEITELERMEQWASHYLAILILEERKQTKQSSNLNRANNLLRKAAKIAEKHQDILALSDIYYRSAWVLTDLREYSQAEEIAQKGLCLCNKGLSKSDQAKLLLLAALTAKRNFQPDLMAERLHLCIAVLKDTKDQDRVNHLRLSEALLLLAAYSREKSDFEEEIKFLEKAQANIEETAPNLRAELWNQLMKYYLAASEKRKAKQALLRYINTLPAYDTLVADKERRYNNLVRDLNENFSNEPDFAELKERAKISAIR